MKILNKKFAFRLLAFLVIAVMVLPMALGQDPINPIDTIKDAIDAPTWDILLSKETAITAALILIGGYLSPFVPFIRKIPKGAYRVAAFAVIIVIALVKGFGVGSWAGSAIAYFFSTSIYELVFKWLGLGTKAKETAAKVYNDPLPE
jgi:hypothetical protein